MRGGLPANFNGFHRADVAENARIWMRENCLRIAEQQGKDATDLEQKIDALLNSPAHDWELRDKISSVISYDEESFTIKLITHFREILRLQGTQQPDTWYVHDELPVGDWIRTVKVLPKKDSAIRCEMRAVERSKASYRCLSYEWVRNYRANTHIILLNGLPFRVRENLYDFLNLAQVDYPDEEFWIDAMCIDQTNMQERNDQVGKMGETYFDKRVLAWLGSRKPEDRPTDPYVYPELEVFKARSDESYEWIKEAYRIIREFWGWPGYWLRAWIVQEQQLAAEVVLQLDNEQYTVAGLEQIRAQAYDMLESFSPKSAPGRNIFYNTRVNFDQLEITAFMKRRRGVRRTSLTDMSSEMEDRKFGSVLKAHRHTYCENWHDKIYALRALCKDGLRINVDYESNLRTLLIEVLSAPRLPFCLCFVQNLVKMYRLVPNSPELADMYVESEIIITDDEKVAFAHLIDHDGSSDPRSLTISLEKICSNLTNEILLEKDSGHLTAKMPWSNTALQAFSRSRLGTGRESVVTVRIPVSAMCLQYLTVFASRYDEVACDVSNTTFIHPATNLAAQPA